MALRRSELIAIGGAVAALVFFGWMLRPPLRAQSAPGTSAVDRQAASAALLEGRWRAAATGDTQSPDATEVLGDAISAKILDPDRVLSQEQKRLLSETIARELMARASKDPLEYLRQVEATPGTRWINAEDEDYWATIDLWYEELFGKAPTREDPRSILERVAESQLVKAGNRIIRYGTGEGGMFVCAFKVRSEDQLNDRFAEFFNKDDFEYWFSAPSTGAIWVRIPIRSFDHVLREENQALVGASLIAVEVKGGWTYARYCYWYWDHDSNSWQCHLFSRKGVVRGVLF